MIRRRSSRSEAVAAKPRGAAPVAAVGACLFALATGVCAIAGFWAFAAPASPVAAVLPLSGPHARLAISELTPGKAPVDLSAAEHQTRWELALAPTTATAWVRLAYIDYWRHGQLTPAGFASLNRSYEIAPLGPDASASRLMLGFELWPSMTPDLRDQILRELKAFRERDADATRDFATRVRNPAGRLAVGMAIAELELRDALKASNQR